MNLKIHPVIFNITIELPPIRFIYKNITARRKKMIPSKEDRNTRIKDFSYQDFQEDDEKDFYIRTFKEEQILEPSPRLDDEETFEKDMYNWGDEDDLPNSDRLMECQSKGIRQENCFDL